MSKRKPIVIWTAITLILFILASTLVIATDTSCGQVKVKSGYVLNDFGDTVKYKAYIPKTATADTPAPVVIYAHGGSDGTSVQSAYCIELSRRGYAVVTWDASGAVESEISDSVNKGGEAIFNMVNGWNFVDKENIITAGHSAGADLSMGIAQNHPEQVLMQINIGYDRYGNKEFGYDFNFAFIVSLWDDSCIARTTNSGTINEVFQAPALKEIFDIPEGEDLVPDQKYGDWANKAGRVVLTEHCAHMYYPVDRETQADFVSIINDVYPMPNAIPANNQVWQIEHIGSALLYICLASVIFIIVTSLLNTKFFSTLVLPELKMVGFKKFSWQWWITLVVMLVLPVITFRLVVVTGLYTKMMWFITLKSKEYGLWMGWSIVTAAAYLVLFLIFHFTYGKKNGGDSRNYGFATTCEGTKFCIGYVLKAVLYALVVMVSTYIIFLGMKEITNTNIHIIAYSITPIEKHRWFIFIFFFIFQLFYFVFGSLASRSLNVNNGDRANVKGMIGSITLGALIGVVGMVVLRIVLMIGLYTQHRNIGFVDLYWLLGSNGVSALFFNFLIANGLNCYITNKTNSIYAGVTTAMLWSTWMMVACQRAVAYFL